MAVRGRAVDVAEIAVRVAEQPGRGEWTVALAAPETTDEVVSELVEALQALPDDGPVTAVAAAGTQDVIDAVKTVGIRVIAGVSALPESEWARLDRQRSQLMSAGSTILVLTEDAMDRLARHAPNLHSWIGGAMWTVDTALPELSPDAVADRLEALRAWSGLSDAEVVARAERGELPGDPEYAEWLVLLDCGDLIEREP